MKIPTISVIIPVYNEERTISSIVEIVRTWGKASEIIVVNDGSTDKTDAALKQFKNTISLITYKTNRGKGFALSRAIEKSSGEILLFLDGDVVGLTHKDLSALLMPVIRDDTDMVLGLARFWNVGSYSPFDGVTGERVLWRKNIIGRVNQMRKAGRGVEFLINDIHKHLRVKSIKLSHVFILGKWEKQAAPDAILDYLKEAQEFVGQIVRLHAKDVTPQVKRAIRIAYSYLKQALDSIQ